jgi:hypothetical protein
VAAGRDGAIRGGLESGVALRASCSNKEQVVTDCLRGFNTWSKQGTHECAGTTLKQRRRLTGRMTGGPRSNLNLNSRSNSNLNLV